MQHLTEPDLCYFSLFVVLRYVCISGFMDDVTFGHSGPYGDAWNAEPLTYYTTSGVAILGRSLMSMNALF